MSKNAKPASPSKGASVPAGVATWDPNSGEKPLLGTVDEVQLDAPTKSAVYQLGVLCAATLIMWAAGRAACNYHVPGEGLTPRAVSLEERVRNPKGAAIEVAQALSGADFATAEKLVLPSAAALVSDAKKCGECSAEKAARPRLMSVGDVLQASRTEAYVSVRTVGGPSGEVERVLLLSRDPSANTPWKVAQAFPSRDGLKQLDDALSPQLGALEGQQPRPNGQRMPMHMMPGHGQGQGQGPLRFDVSPTGPGPGAPAPAGTAPAPGAPSGPAPASAPAAPTAPAK